MIKLFATLSLLLAIVSAYGATSNKVATTCNSGDFELQEVRETGEGEWVYISCNLIYKGELQATDLQSDIIDIPEVINKEHFRVFTSNDEKTYIQLSDKSASGHIYLKIRGQYYNKIIPLYGCK